VDLPLFHHTIREVSQEIPDIDVAFLAELSDGRNVAVPKNNDINILKLLPCIGLQFSTGVMKIAFFPAGPCHGLGQFDTQVRMDQAIKELVDLGSEKSIHEPGCRGIVSTVAVADQHSAPIEHEDFLAGVDFKPDRPEEGAVAELMIPQEVVHLDPFVRHPGKKSENPEIALGDNGPVLEPELKKVSDDKYLAGATQVVLEKADKELDPFILAIRVPIAEVGIAEEKVHAFHITPFAVLVNGERGAVRNL
jgi:hypothetical protein